MPARYDCEERICSILSRAWNTPFTSVSSVVGQRHGSGHEIYRTVEIMGWRVRGREGGRRGSTNGLNGSEAGLDLVALTWD